MCKLRHILQMISKKRDVLQNQWIKDYSRIISLISKFCYEKIISSFKKTKAKLSENGNT